MSVLAARASAACWSAARRASSPAAWKRERGRRCVGEGPRERERLLVRDVVRLAGEHERAARQRDRDRGRQRLRRAGEHAQRTGRDAAHRHVGPPGDRVGAHDRRDGEAEQVARLRGERGRERLLAGLRGVRQHARDKREALRDGAEVSAGGQGQEGTDRPSRIFGT